MKYEEKDLSITRHKSKIGGCEKTQSSFFTASIFMLLLEIFLVQIISDIAKGYTAHNEYDNFRLAGTRKNEESCDTSNDDGAKKKRQSFK